MLSWPHAKLPMILFAYGSYETTYVVFVLIPIYLSVYREALYLDRINEILRQLPRWREERLPPPRVSQSEVSTYIFP
jgi:hypothetical protein